MRVEEAPPAVGAAITREMGNGWLVKGVCAENNRDGSLVFITKGQSTDGRAMALRLAEDGSVLGRSTEIPVETVPAAIRNPANEAFPGFDFTRAMEIIAGDKISYAFTAKRPDAATEITVRGDGSLSSYSVHLRGPE